VDVLAGVTRWRPAARRGASRGAGRRGAGRRRWAWLAAAVAVAAGWAVWFSGLFAVRDVAVVGSDTRPAREVVAAAHVPMGRPLARVDTGAVRRRVAALPGVESVRVVRAWPSTVRIEVTEREPVAVVQRDGGLWLVDGGGVVFERVGSRPPGLPRLDLTADAAGRAALEVARALPVSLRTLVERISARTPESVELRLRDGRTVVWGGSDRNGEKARVLRALLHQPGQSYDVSTPTVVVVR
jgi:cell division protein FtsQ